MFRRQLVQKSVTGLGYGGNPARWFRSDSSHPVRFRHRRNSQHPSQVLLDKFVKHAKVDASIVVKAPFSFKVKVSWQKASFLNKIRY
jgi:hypothetical protein